jgi:hypothetical protein
VDVDDDEEHRAAVHVQIAQKPAVVDVAHDALDRFEGVIDVRRVAHGQHDARYDHDDQHDPGERAEVPPVVQVPGRRVSRAHRFVDEREDRQPVLDPLDDRIGVGLRGHGLPPYPIRMVVSVRNA